MFLPQWLLWLLFVIIVLYLANKYGTPRGQYDCVSPLIGLSIILIAVAFGAGFLLAHLL